MDKLTKEQKKHIYNKLEQAREIFSGTDAQFAKKYALSKTAYSRIKNGELDGVISDTNWYIIADKLNILAEGEEWKVAKTQVFEKVEEAISICQNESVGMLFCDECEIGKTFTAQYIASTRKHTYYVDCSQAKIPREFIPALAEALGLDTNGKLSEIKGAIKTALKIMSQKHKIVIILDEFGDLGYNAFLDVKEFYNSTAGRVGWLAMGADGLEYKMKKGIKNRKQGFREIFSRMGGKVRRATPIGEHKEDYYRNMIGQILVANGCPAEKLNEAINKCLVKGDDGSFYALRRIKVILKNIKGGQLL